MLGRLIRKFILTLSIALAIALIVLALSSRHGDRVLSVARNGNYRELRSDRTRLSFTNISGWSNDRPAQSGRTEMPPSNEPAMMLLDKTQLTLTSNKKGWWPPLRDDGTAFLSDPAMTNLTISSGTPTTMPYSAITVSGSTLIVGQGSLGSPPTTMPGATTMTLSRVPTTLPNAVSYSVNTAGVSLPTTSATIYTGTATLNLTGNFIVMMKPYTYERYSIPHAAAVAVVLTPVWIVLLMGAMRWRRRRVRRRRGLCVACGYDLRGSRAGAACPECGQAAVVGADAAMTVSS